MALGCGLTPMPIVDLTKEREKPLGQRLGLDIAIAGRPRMPAKKPRSKAKA